MHKPQVRFSRAGRNCCRDGRGSIPREVSFPPFRAEQGSARAETEARRRTKADLVPQKQGLPRAAGFGREQKLAAFDWERPRVLPVRESSSLRLFRRGARLGRRTLHPRRLLLRRIRSCAARRPSRSPGRQSDRAIAAVGTLEIGRKRTPDLGDVSAETGAWTHAIRRGCVTSGGGGGRIVRG